MSYWIPGALSMSIGWGIRGQFGHEYGAALAGALGAMAVVLLSGREDWIRRILFFGVFGAIGWSFGGSMSYMKAIAYAQSSDPATLLYGFACVFAIGFLWAAPGGAGMALPAVLSREDLTAGMIPMCAVLAAWWFQDIAVDVLHNVPNMYDSDWLGATVALAAAGLVAIVRRRLEPVTALILNMAAGWWIGFTVLVLGFQLHMNPPRGDNWAGCAGMIAGILFWSRSVHPHVTLATILMGFLGGIGFSLGHTLKLVGIATGWHTNWHSVMEQLQGLFYGLALASTMAVLAASVPAVNEERKVRRWTEVFSAVFLLVLIPYVNFRKSPSDWVREIDGMKDWMYGIAAAGWLIPSRGFIGWMELLFIAFAAALLWVIHRRPIAALPDSWKGKGQLFYLALLWIAVVINALHVLPRWTEERLVTEWLIAMNAILVTAVVLSGAAVTVRFHVGARRAVAAGLAGMLAVTAAGYGVRRTLFGDKPTGYIYQEHVRFGPHNTNTIK